MSITTEQLDKLREDITAIRVASEKSSKSTNSAASSVSPAVLILVIALGVWLGIAMVVATVYGYAVYKVNQWGSSNSASTSTADVLRGVRDNLLKNSEQAQTNLKTSVAWDAVPGFTDEQLRQAWLTARYGTGGHKWTLGSSASARSDEDAVMYISEARRRFHWSFDEGGNIIETKPWVGMTIEQLLWAVGRPDRVEKTNDAGDAQEQWVYSVYGTAVTRTFVLKSGKLASWSE